jgi:hypothetical protein
MTFSVGANNKKAHKIAFCELPSVLVCQPVIPLEFEVSSFVFPAFPRFGEESLNFLPLFPGISADFCH